MPSAEAEHSEEAVPAAKENVPAETADTLQVKKTPLAEDEQVQPADSVQKVAQEMRRGHDRIAAMRTKVAAGHEADRAAVYRKVFGGNDNIEAIRRLRSSKTISSGVVRPTAIRADLLEGKLRSFRRSPERLPDIRKSGCRGLFVMCGNPGIFPEQENFRLCA